MTSRPAGEPDPDVDRLPPGQHRVAAPPVMHYGRIPDRDAATWTVTVGGATASGAEHVLPLAEVLRLPPVRRVCDMHCATRWSATDIEWSGVAASDVMAIAPPARGVVGALVFAEFGYAANVQIDDLAQAVLATHQDGEPLPRERGAPLRLVIPQLYTWKGPKWLRGWNYLRPGETDRGFWEQRGYHARGHAWREERFAHQG